MLILTRKPGEVIVIGNNREIAIKVLCIKGRIVKLGIDASTQIPVNREEVYRRIKAEQTKHLQNLLLNDDDEY